MAFRHSFRWLLIGGLAITAPSCGDDGDGTSGAAGTGGGAGQAGSSGTAGTQSAAGTGGSSAGGSSTGGSSAGGSSAGSSAGGSSGSAGSGGGMSLSSACRQCGDAECSAQVAACLADDVCRSCLEENYQGPGCDETLNEAWRNAGSCVCGDDNAPGACLDECPCSDGDGNGGQGGA